MAPRPSRVADVETGWQLRSRFVQSLKVLRKYASVLHSLRPCRQARLTIRESSR